MSNGAGEAEGASQRFSDAEVLEGSYRLEAATEGSQPARRLFLRTYELAEARGQAGSAPRPWRALPMEDWPLLATILADRIIMRPVHTNPHAQRYLKPKNGRFTTVIYIDEWEGKLLDDAEDSALQIEERLAWRLFDLPRFGLGLIADLDAVWRGLSRLEKADVLVISDYPAMHAKEGAVSICIAEVDKLRRDFNRVAKSGRDLIRRTKERVVHDELLTRLDPERFQRLVHVNAPLIEVRREGPRQAASREPEVRRSSVQTVRKQLDQLVTEAPFELKALHAEIERVTLAQMIEDFKAKLASKLPEPDWQRFFEANKFVLSMAFARPVALLHTQFHAKGSALTGSGAQIGDFLFKEAGQALAIVEIKTPETALLQGAAYRGEEVFGPHSMLSGAVTQVLFQQSHLRQVSGWPSHLELARRP